ncbi:MAG: alpha/beta hydrolase [Rhodanobacteraceae bacterium]
MVNAVLLFTVVTTMGLPPSDSVVSQPITLKTATGDISGTLVAPSGSSAHPVVLIIAGSGPTDRDGNSAVAAGPGKSVHPDSYRLLASDLAAQGIASVRYDKRGVGASAAAMAGQTECDYRFDTGVTDAAAQIASVYADPSIPLDPALVSAIASYVRSAPQSR